jgi:hypothetical protein
MYTKNIWRFSLGTNKDFDSDLTTFEKLSNLKPGTRFDNF